MQIKEPEYLIKEYRKLFGEDPPEGDYIRQDTEERLYLIEEAIKSGIPIPPSKPLEPHIDY